MKLRCLLSGEHSRDDPGSGSSLILVCIGGREDRCPGGGDEDDLDGRDVGGGGNVGNSRNFSDENGGYPARSCRAIGFIGSSPGPDMNGNGNGYLPETKENEKTQIIGHGKFTQFFLH